MFTKRNIIYSVLLLAIFVYGIAIGRYQIFPYYQLRSVQDWITETDSDNEGPDNLDIIETSLQRLLIKGVPVESDYSPDLYEKGGAITSLDSLIYMSTNRNDEKKDNLVVFDARNFKRLEIKGLSVPLNYNELLKSPIMEIEDFPLFRFRVNGLYVEKTGESEYTLFVTHSEYHPEKRCISFSVSRISINFGNSNAEISKDWNTIFRASPCVYPEEDQHGHEAYSGQMSGGAMINYDRDHLLVSVGDFHRDGVEHKALTMDNTSSFGKIILLNKQSGEHSIFAKGFRNPQGLYKDTNKNIWATDHGPKGGDELNLIEEGKNYGWPEATYGIDYGNKQWPLNEVQGRHDDFNQPVHAWVPSIGISDVTRLDNLNKFPLWSDDLLVSSLRDNSLYRIRLGNNDRIVYSERIEIDYRLRDLTILEDESLAIITDQGVLLIIEDGGPVFKETGSVVEARISALDEYDSFYGESQVDFNSDKHASAETIFIRKCSSCHYLNETNGVGPHLNNIFSRGLGEVEDFNYSNAFSKSDKTWNPELIEDFLLQNDPRFSKTSMPKIDLSESEVDSIIHYLRIKS